MAEPAVVVGADKGGVGKTTVARTVLDYFTAHHLPARAYDSEAPKGTSQPQVDNAGNLAYWMIARNSLIKTERIKKADLSVTSQTRR
jgi:MinD superfamily P-loop ATPase